MKKIALISFALVLFALVAFAQQTHTITYKPKNIDCSKVYLTLFYHYDTLAEIIDYSVMIDKKDNVFTKTIQVPQQLIALGVNFYEAKEEMIENGQGLMVKSKFGSVFVDAKKPNESITYKLMPNQKPVPEHLRFYHTESDYIEQLKVNPKRNDTHGFFFLALNHEKYHGKYDSIAPLFDKYGRDLLLKLDGKQDAQSLFSLVILHTVNQDSSKALISLQQLKTVAPHGSLFNLAAGFYHNLAQTPFETHEEFTANVLKYPLSFNNDFLKGMPLILKSYKISFENAMLAHEHYYKAAGLHSPLNFSHKFELFESYDRPDSAYLYAKILNKGLKEGTIDVQHDALYGWDGNGALNFDYAAEYEIKKGWYNDARQTINTAYDFYITHYKKIGFMQTNLTSFTNTKLKAHENLAQLDSAIQTCITTYSVDNNKDWLKKGNEYFSQKYGKEANWQEFLMKKDIKYEVETVETVEIAPEATLKQLENDSNLKLADLKGKVIVLNFWGTFCAPCIKEVPLLNALKMKYANEPHVVFIAVSRENKLLIERFQNKENKFEFLQIYDGEDVIQAFNINLFPTSVVINKKGEITFRHIGADKDIDYKLDKAIEKELY